MGMSAVTFSHHALCAGYEEVRLTTRDLHLRDPDNIGAQDPYPVPRPSTPAEALVIWLWVRAGQLPASSSACQDETDASWGSVAHICCCGTSRCSFATNDRVLSGPSFCLDAADQAPQAPACPCCLILFLEHS